MGLVFIVGWVSWFTLSWFLILKPDMRDTFNMAFLFGFCILSIFATFMLPKQKTTIEKIRESDNYMQHIMALKELEKDIEVDDVSNE